MKIAMIGAGSIGFTRRLVHDILAVPEFHTTTFAFMDISRQNLDRVTALCERDIRANDLPATIIATENRQEAIDGADYIVCMIRQGGLEAFESDIEIPLKYGIDQCVGDTLCAGGIMYAQRTIPVMLDICRDIRDYANSEALFLNYSNPMAMNTWACLKYGGVPTVGLCHGVQGSHWQITHAIQHWAQQEGLIGPDETIHRRDVTITAAGINHQTWFVQIEWRGMDLIPRLYDIFMHHPTYPITEKVRLDVLRRFGYYSTESNGHLSEYVPWYRKRPEELPQWIDLSSWINGETGGYLRYCREERLWFEANHDEWMHSETRRIGPENRSEEHASYIIEALETGRIYRGHLNVANQKHITNLPDGCVIEVPAYIDRSGIQVPVIGDLPLACAATCSASVRVQQMGMEAAVHGDVTLLKQAMLHDPLMGAVCNPEEIWQMADEMLVAQQQWLPQYAGEISGAESRLRAAETNGTRAPVRPTTSASHLPLRTLDEIAAEKAAERATQIELDRSANPASQN
jgi:alpha-galactosidase